MYHLTREQILKESSRNTGLWIPSSALMEYDDNTRSLLATMAHNGELDMELTGHDVTFWLPDIKHYKLPLNEYDED